MENLDVLKNGVDWFAQTFGGLAPAGKFFVAMFILVPLGMLIGFGGKKK